MTERVATLRNRWAVPWGDVPVLGDEHFVVGRIVDEPGHDRVLAFERDRDREVRDAVQEIGGAVERIDNPQIFGVRVGVFGGAFLC